MSTSTKLYQNDSELFSQPTLYRSVISDLQYLILTRPDINFVVNRLNQYLQSTTEAHWSACKRVLRYLKGTSHLGLLFQPISNFSLVSFSDANWASNLDDRRSTGGYCVFLGPILLA